MFSLRATCSNGHKGVALTADQRAADSWTGVAIRISATRGFMIASPMTARAGDTYIDIEAIEIQTSDSIIQDGHYRR